MPPKEPSRYQYSSRLTYNEHTPAFLRRLQNKVSGAADDDEDDFDDWQAASGRPPIPRRPTPPQRPADDPGSADEDDPDEKPQVVVLREGKHMTAEEAERYAENERRTVQGLAPVPDKASLESKDATGKEEDTSSKKQESDEKETKAKSTSLSFSSSGTASSLKSSAKKRKAVGDGFDKLLVKENAEKKHKQKSKAKKAKTGALLSFTDDDK